MRVRIRTAAIWLFTIPLTGCALRYFVDELIEANREYDDIPGVKLVSRPSYEDLYEAQGVPAYAEFLTATDTTLTRRAIAFENGFVRVDGPSGQVFEEFNTQLVRGMAWSGDGTRLVLVERVSVTDAQHVLHVRDEMLNIVATYTFVVPSINALDRYIVSWSADDACIAVSSSLYYSFAWPLIYQTSKPLLVLTNVADGRQSTHDASDAYFVGDRELLFTSPPEDEISTTTAKRVFSGRYSDDGSIEEIESLSGIEFVVGSSARDEVFIGLSRVLDCAANGLCATAESVDLRSLAGDAERRFVGYYFNAGPGEGNLVIQRE